MEFSFRNLQTYNYRREPVMFIKLLKIPEIKFTLEFSFAEADTTDSYLK